MPTRTDPLSSLGAHFDKKTIANMYKNVKLQPHVKTHLMKVYGVLFVMCIIASLGSLAHLFYHLGGILTFGGSLISMIALSQDVNETRRLAWMSILSFCTGCSIGPLVEQANMIDPSIVVTAFLGTAVIFCCFTMTAIMANKRLRLYLGGLISSAFSVLMLLSIIRMFYSSSTIVHTLYLYLGLFIFCGYVIVDTQMIIEKVRTGQSNDYVWHATELFTDFIGIFVRIVSILVQNSSKQKGKKSKEKK